MIEVLKKLQVLHAIPPLEFIVVPKTRFRSALDVCLPRLAIAVLVVVEKSTLTLESNNDQFALVVETESKSVHYTNMKMEDYADQDDLMDTATTKKNMIRKQELRTPSPKTNTKKSPTSTQKNKKRNGALFPIKSGMYE